MPLFASLVRGRRSPAAKNKEPHAYAQAKERPAVYLKLEHRLNTQLDSTRRLDATRLDSARSESSREARALIETKKNVRLSGSRLSILDSQLFHFHNRRRLLPLESRRPSARRVSRLSALGTRLFVFSFLEPTCAPLLPVPPQHEPPPSSPSRPLLPLRNGDARSRTASDAPAAIRRRGVHGFHARGLGWLTRAAVGVFCRRDDYALH